jgi:hypothetical protein
MLAFTGLRELLLEIERSVLPEKNRRGQNKEACPPVCDEAGRLYYLRDAQIRRSVPGIVNN